MELFNPRGSKGFVSKFCVGSHETPEEGCNSQNIVYVTMKMRTIVQILSDKKLNLRNLDKEINYL